MCVLNVIGLMIMAFRAISSISVFPSKNKIYKNNGIKFGRLTYFVLNCTDISNFDPVEVVCSSTETQLQMGKKLNFIM